MIEYNGNEMDGGTLPTLNEVLGRLPDELTSLKSWLSGIPKGYGYCTFKIPKRNKQDYRQIDAPNEYLLALQRSVYNNLLRDNAIEKPANGFVPNRSIVDNARPHVGQKVVINIDLKDFFHSIKAQQVFRYWRIGWNKEAAIVLTNICCYKGHLPQGAPTSPALSNVVNSALDLRLMRLTYRLGGKYTRYADDLTFSFGGELGRKQRKLLPELRKILSEYGYEIQAKKKVRVQRQHQRQAVTGLVVNSKINLPRSTRKRIRAMQHHQKLGRLSAEEEKRLTGYEAFWEMIRRSQKPKYKPTDKKKGEIYMIIEQLTITTVNAGIQFLFSQLGKLTDRLNKNQLEKKNQIEVIMQRGIDSEQDVLLIKKSMTELLESLQNEREIDSITSFKNWIIDQVTLNYPELGSLGKLLYILLIKKSERESNFDKQNELITIAATLNAEIEDLLKHLKMGNDAKDIKINVHKRIISALRYL